MFSRILLQIAIYMLLSILIAIFASFLLSWNSEKLNLRSLNTVLQFERQHGTHHLTAYFDAIGNFSRVTISDYFCLLLIPLAARHIFLCGFWPVHKAVYLLVVAKLINSNRNDADEEVMKSCSFNIFWFWLFILIDTAQQIIAKAVSKVWFHTKDQHTHIGPSPQHPLSRVAARKIFSPP